MPLFLLKHQEKILHLHWGKPQYPYPGPQKLLRPSWPYLFAHPEETFSQQALLKQPMPSSIFQETAADLLYPIHLKKEAGLLAHLQTLILYLCKASQALHHHPCSVLQDLLQVPLPCTKRLYQHIYNQDPALKFYLRLSCLHRQGRLL